MLIFKAETKCNVVVYPYVISVCMYRFRGYAHDRSQSAPKSTNPTFFIRVDVLRPRTGRRPLCHVILKENGRK